MITAISFIFVLGVLVFVHELGHFMVAKSAGIRVEQFSLGFPPKMVSKKLGDTDYRISWIPLGGYVKMAGENPDEELKGEAWEFMSKPAMTRALVVLAGPIMNFLLAILIFWGIFFFQGIPEAHTDIGSVLKGSPADKAGMKPGDRISSINGQAVQSFDQIAIITGTQVEEPIEVVWVRGDTTIKAIIVTVKEEVFDKNGNRKAVGKIGIGANYTTRRIGILAAFREGMETVFLLVKEMAGYVFGLVIGTVSLKMLGGPVLIAQIAGETARHGFISLLFFTAILSVNLCLLNVLPIPVLDGGHLLFLFIEKLKGKPLPAKHRALMQQVGLAFILLLMIVVTYNDILRVFGKT